LSVHVRELSVVRERAEKIGQEDEAFTVQINRVLMHSRKVGIVEGESDPKSLPIRVIVPCRHIVYYEST
jgi:hypothetical protein